jgi:hypothetical protein
VILWWRVFLATIGLLFFSLNASAEGSLLEVHRLLAKPSQMCAEFTQKKILRALKRPLTSKGRLVMVTGDGVLWQVRDPITARIVIKRNALIQWDDENVPRRRDLGQSPIFQALTKVFMAVFSGTVTGLSTSFAVEAHVEGAKWRLILVPRDPQMTQVISTIHVSGGRYIESLAMHEGQGDQIQIQFRNVETAACKLSPEEKRFLAY